MKVFYTDAQDVPNNCSFSPSAGKPMEAVASWRALGIPLEVVTPEPASEAELALAHDRAYVRGVLIGKHPNGFGNTSADVAASLPWTTGSLLSATRHALFTGESCASPTSGFHHASYDLGGGFCTFNGLVVAAQAVRREGLARRVGILDCDVHYGNGTDSIIRKLRLGHIQHYTYGHRDAMRASAERWLEDLPRLMQSFARCDVLLYQAGADPHIDDPLGGVLTTAQMARRDKLVFEAASRMGIPVVWNLAGGYQTPLRNVLDLHDNTARAFVEVFDRVTA